MKEFSKGGNFIKLPTCTSSTREIQYQWDSKLYYWCEGHYGSFQRIFHNGTSKRQAWKIQADQ
jgi:hypothetical protein